MRTANRPPTARYHPDLPPQRGRDLQHDEIVRILHSPGRRALTASAQRDPIKADGTSQEPMVSAKSGPGAL
jgi:hypothetical protein